MELQLQRGGGQLHFVPVYQSMYNVLNIDLFVFSVLPGRITSTTVLPRSSIYASAVEANAGKHLGRAELARTTSRRSLRWRHCEKNSKYLSSHAARL